MSLPPDEERGGPGPLPPASPPLAPLAAFLLLAAAGVHLAFDLSEAGFLASGRLADTDSWTRALRVLELWEGAGWFEEATPRLNAPFGLSLHWTRPLDLLILLPALLLHALAGLGRAEAVLLAGAWLCPVLHWLCALAAARAARPLWPGMGPLWAGILVLGSPSALGYSALGRADHHTLVLLAGLLALGDALRATLTPGDGRAAWRAGAFAGAGIWVSPEALLFAAPVLAGFGLLWVLEGRRNWPEAGMAQQGLRAALGLAAVCLLAVAVEHPPARWLAGEYDKVSAQHALIGLLAAGVFAGAMRLAPRPHPLRRAAWGGALAVLALGALLALRPQALQASIAGADAAAAALFLPQVREMQPLNLLSRDDWQFLGAAALAPLALALAWPRWARSGHLAPVAAILVPAFLLCLVASLRHLRFSLDLAAPASLLAAGLPGLALEARAPFLARMGGAIAAVLGTAGLPVLLALLPAAPEATAREPAATASPAAGCALESVVAALREGAAAPPSGAPPPVLMASDINLGPELAWRTGYRVVGAPYHRGGAAILDTQALFGATEDSAAREVAERRQVSLLLLCPGPEGREPTPGTLAARLREGAPPAWLAPLPLPDLPPGVLLFARRS